MNMAHVLIILLTAIFYMLSMRPSFLDFKYELHPFRKWGLTVLAAFGVMLLIISGGNQLALQEMPQDEQSIARTAILENNDNNTSRKGTNFLADYFSNSCRREKQEEEPPSNAHIAQRLISLPLAFFQIIRGDHR